MERSKEEIKTIRQELFDLAEKHNLEFVYRQETSGAIQINVGVTFEPAAQQGEG